MTRGKFITLEGIEGAGKSTCLAQVKTLIEAKGHSLVITREPGGTSLGEKLRELLLSHQQQGMTDDAELLLMFAARAEHIGTVIEPALATGKWVLSDRFTDASFAYQGGGRHLADERINILADWVQRDLMPDLTLLLDLPVAVGLDRAGKRSTPDRFEVEKNDFFDRVRAKYLQLAANDPMRMKVIDSSLPLHDVEQQIIAVVHRFIAAV